MKPVVIDTNVFIGALQTRDGVNRAVLEDCFMDRLTPLMGDALFWEYEALVGRKELQDHFTLSAEECADFLDDFLSICRWVKIYYQWRPNLRDEGDNHIIELAVSGGAKQIISWNERDFQRGDLLFTDFEVVTPVAYLKSRQFL